MLYVIYKRDNPELAYRDGQEHIIHLEADLHQGVTWANANHRCWVFTSSNAGAYYFDDYSNLSQLNKLDWDAIPALYWKGRTEGKQAEFLIERSLESGFAHRRTLG